MSKNRSISLFHLQVIATTLPKALFYCLMTLSGSVSKPADGRNSPANGKRKVAPGRQDTRRPDSALDFDPSEEFDPTRPVRV